MAKNKEQGAKPAMSKRELANARRAKKIRQQRLKAAAVILVIALVIGGFVGLGFALGWWDYQPTATMHVAIELDNGESLHVELYGNDAPETVEAFVELVNHGHFNGSPLELLLDGKLLACDAGEEITIAGEFKNNGVKNRVPHKAGTLTMILADENDPDSANGSFGILLDEAPELDENRAAFGRIDNVEALNKLITNIDAGKELPSIKSISAHHSH